MRGHKLKSGVSLYRELKQKGTKQTGIKEGFGVPVGRVAGEICYLIIGTVYM